MKENEKEIVVKADLPGLDEKDINLTIHNGVLSLRGEKKSEHTDERDNYHMMERSYGSFQRSIRLPDTIDEDKVEARFDKGVLTVTLPLVGDGQRSKENRNQGRVTFPSKDMRNDNRYEFGILGVIM